MLKNKKTAVSKEIKTENSSKIKDIKLKEASKIERALKSSSDELLAKALSDLLKRDSKK